jgi:cbb3-type cytochrome oxidase cytochrome c subunit
MKGFTPLILGILATLAFSWLGLAYIPDLQIGHLEPQSDEEGTDIYPMPRSGMAERGRHVYVANGCFYCHSQQVRADYAAADVDLQRWGAPSPRPKWGDRRSAPRDYIFDRPALIGRTRLGPDLANIGKAAPAEEEAITPAQPAPAGSPGGSPAPANASPAAGSASPPAANAPAQPGAKPPQRPAPAGSPGGSPASASASPAPGNASPPPANAPAQPSEKPPAQPSPSAATAPSQPSAVAGASPSQAAAGASPAPAMSPSQAVTGSSPAASSSESPAPYSAAWHHQHLYSPRSLNLDSDMPAYKFLYEKRRIGGQQSADALHLRSDEASEEGWEIVPTYDAKCLVAYLMSLNQSHPLPEVKSAPAGSPAASPAAAQPAAKK